MSGSKSRFLIVSEGKDPETDFLALLARKLSYTLVQTENTLDCSLSFKTYFERDYQTLANGDKCLYFVRLKDPKIKELLRIVKDRNNFSLPEIVCEDPHFFQGAFFLHDVDHYDSYDIQELQAIFSSPDRGLLVLSMPCIEALNDDRIDARRSYDMPKAYINELHQHLRKDQKEYFAEHYQRLLTHHVQKNVSFLSADNFMDHGKLLADRLPDLRLVVPTIDQVRGHLEYSFFTSHVYVILGVLFGIQFDEDNCAELCRMISQLPA
jgi:hypothetical protein